VTESVIDASTLLAVILSEPMVGPHDLLDRALMSAVNLTEVRTKLIDLGRVDLRELSEDLIRLVRIVPFTEQQAILAASLRDATRHAGLSLGDRACLALAIHLNADVYTADRSWMALNVGCKVHLVR
jgi:PIN domain nuclease of toxin-antitoxin system